MGGVLLCVCQSLSKSSAVRLEPTMLRSKATAAMTFCARVEVEVGQGNRADGIELNGRQAV